MLRSIIYIVFFATFLQFSQSAPSSPQTNDLFIHPDAGLNALELIERYGYPFERHWVTTEDGYILEMHRIPHGLDNADEEDKPIVLVVHGLISSSADFVNMGNRSLAFLLADLGYDVWLGNCRGVVWSRNHTTLDPDADNSFWLYSWNEIGVYDLPAKIDYVLQHTGGSNLFYIGHSQGTTSFYVMTSERPEYNEKIRLMVAMAPVAYMSHVMNPFLQIVAEFHDSLEWLAEFLGIYEFLPHNDFIAELAQELCDDDEGLAELCGNLLFLVMGFDSEQLDLHTVSVIVTNSPAGSATRQFLHYAQGIKSAMFRKYDFGLVENLVVYGQVTPPLYDISKITAPVALFYGANDRLTAVTDVEQLRDELPNVVLDYLIPFEQWNHIDFLFAIDVVDLLYNRIFEIMSQY